MEVGGDEKLEILLKWAAEVGITDSKASPSESLSSSLGHSLFVSHFPEAGGRGLAALRGLRKGELILRVPKSALMTRETLLKDETLSIALNPHSSLSPIQILSTCLLYEMNKGKSSWWYPYLMNLPPSYDILATFGEFEKQALQVDEAIWAAEKAMLKAELDWKEASVLMTQLNLKPRLSTFRAWLWASATISSRTLHIQWDEAGCLCPVGDLFNYAAPPGEEPSRVEDLNCKMHASSFGVNPSVDGDATDMLDLEKLDSHSERLTDGGFEEDVAAYCFYARRHYKKGEQVLLCYGSYTNLELLEHYGFILNENSGEKVFIPLESEMCSSNSWPKESMYIQQNGKPSFALLSALRLWATRPNQRRSVAHLAYSGSQLSAENEILVMRWISKKCTFVLKSLPTSFDEDRSLLSAIEILQNSFTPSELSNVLASSTNQICAFLEANGLESCGSGALSSKKITQAIGRWILAVQWRLSYKETLIKCVSYCSKVIDSLNSQNVTVQFSS
ncbi:N-lysine methyltransferase SETD [Parasponia andersonii]|uniref:N-lysine methyltransferase SETD n=1 Tax=Parasponia andersonii TaxID=3476 RepID=A0A2P5C3F8_PARAD|nr:N-lysine methyltransferase SETD [Parasponia andersonii]